MEIFRVARRLRPRRVSRVVAHDSIPEPVIQPGIPEIPRPRAMPPWIGGLFVIGVTVFVLTMDSGDPGQGGGDVAVTPTRPASPGTSAGPGGSGAPGQPGDGGRGAPAAAVMLNLPPTEAVLPIDPGAKVLEKARYVVFRLREEPTTRENLEERLELFKKVFDSLDPTDRQALFGVTDFTAIEKAVLAQADKSAPVLDKLMTQLKLVLF